MRYFVQMSQDRLLVRDRHVGPGKAQRAQPAHRFADVVGVDRHGHVHPIQPQGGEGGVVHGRADAVLHRPAHDADQRGGTGDGGRRLKAGDWVSSSLTVRQLSNASSTMAR